MKIKILNSNFKKIIKEELATILKETTDDEWAGLSYKEVSSKLKEMGVDPTGKWWLDYKYSHPARKKYRGWYKTRNQESTTDVPETQTGIISPGRKRAAVRAGRPDEVSSMEDGEVATEKERLALYREWMNWSSMPDVLKKRAMLNRKRFIDVWKTPESYHTWSGMRVPQKPKVDVPSTSSEFVSPYYTNLDDWSTREGDVKVKALRSDAYFGLSKHEIDRTRHEIDHVDLFDLTNGYREAKIIQQGHNRGTKIAWSQSISVFGATRGIDLLKDPKVQDIFRERGEPLCWTYGCASDLIKSDEITSEPSLSASEQVSKKIDP